MYAEGKLEAAFNISHEISNKLALLGGEAQLCLPYVYLKKEK